MIEDENVCECIYIIYGRLRFLSDYYGGKNKGFYLKGFSMKKKLFSVVLATMMAASLTACGKSAGSNSSATAVTVNREVTPEEYAATVTENAAVYKTLVSLAEYKGVEATVDKSILEVTDDDITEYINSILQSAATETTVTEGVTSSGDTITLDYSGKLDGVAFSNGTATDASYTIGSGRFISDLDQGLVGLTLGETYDIPCTFPDDYSPSDLAGKDVIFTVTVSEIKRTTVPELTDQWVADNAETLGIEATDIESLRVSARAYLEETARTNYNSDKYASIWEKVKEGTTANAYPQEELDALLTTLKENVQTEFNTYGSMYGITDFETYIKSVYSFESEDAFNEYAENYSKDYLLEKMFITIVAADNDIVVTADEIFATGADLASYYGYEDYQEILDTYGNEMNAEVGYEVLYQKVLEFLCDNAVEVEE